MKNILILSISIMLFALASCYKTEEKTETITYEGDCTNIDVGFDLYLRNPKGEDLLDPNTKGRYKHEDIDVFDDELLHISLFENKENMLDYDSNGGYLLCLYQDDDNIEKVVDGRTMTCSTQYLKLDSNTIDTIYTESIKESNSLLINKVVYNSKVVFDLLNDIGRKGIIIIKDR